MYDPTYRALLIGNSTFPEDQHTLPNLEGPRNDVVLLRDALCHHEAGLFLPDHVRTVTERTMSEVLREVDDFLQDATTENVLFLYYSGHGMRDQAGDLYLCTRDTRSDRLHSSALKGSVVSLMLNECDARATVVALDCCYSGRFKGAPAADALAGRGRFVIMSSRSGELAYDTDLRNRASLFTNHLVEALRQEAIGSDQDGLVYLSEVYRYVHRTLAAERRQMPTRDFAGQGDVAIARRQRKANWTSFAPSAGPKMGTPPDSRSLVVGDWQLAPADQRGSADAEGTATPVQGKHGSPPLEPDIQPAPTGHEPAQRHTTDRGPPRSTPIASDAATHWHAEPDDDDFAADATTRLSNPRHRALAAALGLAVVVGVVGVLGAVGQAVWDSARPDGGTRASDETNTTPPATTSPSGSGLAAEVLDREAPDPAPPPAETSPDTLEITTLIEGQGDGAAADDTVVVHYVGKTANGDVFDTSWPREPFTLSQLGEAAVIAGFNEGLIGAKVGERRRLVIGSNKAYGAEGQPGGGIPPDAPLAFEIDIVDIVDVG